MIVRPPFVVVISAPSGGVGKSTLASNLAVYLKGLAEDLPVAYASSAAVTSIEAMFALPGTQAGSFAALQENVRLQELLSWGEFGVEFCRIGVELKTDSPNWLRKQLAAADYDGVLILDLAHDHALLRAATWAADLLLAPVKDPAVLGELVAMRREFLAGGGRADQFWLLPSELGSESRYQQADLLEFLRFAAEERDFKVLDETFVADPQVRERAVALAKPVLTRATESFLHLQLRKLAELILQAQRQQSGYLSRVARWQADRLLPERAGRVELLCAVCGEGVLSSEVQYLESYPARKRLLLHRMCISGLLKETGATAFQDSTAVLLLQPGAAAGGQATELRLQVVSPELELLNTEYLQVSGVAGWEDLLLCATGRKLAELYQEQLLLSGPLLATEALDPEWYQTFVSLRRQLRQLCREEKL